MKRSKWLLSLLLLPAMLLADDSDYLIGSLTRQQVHDFGRGLGIGATHGAVNHSIGIACEANDGEMLLIALLATYLAANKFEATCNGGKPNRAMLWGRGIGQILIESLQLVLNEAQKRQLKFKPILNLSIVRALLS